MQKADYQDKSFHAAVHLSDEEAELLRDFHFKQMGKVLTKLEKLRDKALDSGTKYDTQIDELRNTLYYHESSYNEACRILRYYSTLKQIKS